MNEDNSAKCSTCSNAQVTEVFADLRCGIKNHESVLDFFMRNGYTYCGEYKKGTPQYKDNDPEKQKGLN